jgi:hypothetical protein
MEGKRLCHTKAAAQLKMLHFYDESALVVRLTNGVRNNDQEVVFSVGSPLWLSFEPTP